MSLRNLFRAQDVAPTLRDRAAGLRAILGKPSPQTGSLPASGSSDTMKEQAPDAVEAMEAEASSEKLVRDIIAGWAAWGATLGKPQDDVEANAAYEREAARRDDLLDAAQALPASPANIAPKALACAWMEWVCTERPGQPRDSYGLADQLVYDIHATIMGRGVEAGNDEREADTALDLADACDRAILDWNAIQSKSDVENWGDDRLDEALAAYGAVFKRAIRLPSLTLSETQAKARLLLHDLREHQGKDEGQETDDQRLMRVVLREVEGLTEKAAVPKFSGIDFGPDTHIAQLAAEFCRIYARHAVKDRAHMAGDLTEAEWEPSYLATVALMKKLEATQPKTLLGAALRCLGVIGQAGWSARADGSTEGMDPWERVGAQFQDALMADKLAPISILGPDLVGLVNFQAATMDELRAIHDMTNEVSAFAYALVSSGRGSIQNPLSYNERLKPAGILMLWVAEALSSVEDAAYNEIKRRKPASRQDQETRLRTLASLLIANGDHDETAAFARELLAYAEAERRRG